MRTFRFRSLGTIILTTVLLVTGLAAASAATSTVTASASTRCVDGAVTIAVTVKNTGSATVRVTPSSSQGAASAKSVRAGASVSFSLRTGKAKIAEGRVTVTATRTVKGQTVTETVTASHRAKSCATSTPSPTPSPVPTTPSPEPTTVATPAPTAEPTPAPTGSQTPSAEPTAAPSASPQPAPGPAITYTLWRSDNPSEDELDAYARIDAAMTAATERWNRLTDLSRHINVSYAPWVPTAEASNNGDLRFGADRAYMVEGTALHEMAHTLAVGTTWSWDSLCYDGTFHGDRATALLRSWDGPDAQIFCDRAHFWPYGLNYSDEFWGDAFDRNVLLVAAMREDGLADW